MAKAADLENMDVDALLALRADVEKMLVEKGRDLQRQLTRLSVEAGKRRGRPPGKAGRTSVMKGVKIGPKGRKRAAAGAKTANRNVTKKKAARSVRKPRQPKESKTKAEPAAA